MRYLLEATFFFVYASEVDAIYIKEIDLYIPDILALALFGALLIMWNMMFSVRQSCREKILYEVAFFMLPIELFLMLEFAQYHILIAGMFMILLLVSPFFVVSQVKMAGMKRRLQVEDPLEPDSQEIQEQTLRTIHQRIILCACVILAVPSIWAAVVYDLKQPVYMEQRQESVAIELRKTEGGDRGGIREISKRKGESRTRKTGRRT